MLHFIIIFGLLAIIGFLITAGFTLFFGLGIGTVIRRIWKLIK